MTKLNTANHYKNYSEKEKDMLQQLEKLIFLIAEDMNIPIEVSLKWQQLTFSSKTGTPIRIDRFDDQNVAILVHCQTTLIEEFRELYPNWSYSKTRAVLFETDKKIAFDETKHFIQRALTYKT